MSFFNIHKIYLKMFVEGHYAFVMPTHPMNQIMPFYMPNEEIIQASRDSNSNCSLFQEQKTKEKSTPQKFDELTTYIAEMEQKINELETENAKLRRHLRPKRRYTKRRSNLQKCFCCPVSTCNLSYSSKIALSNHLKKKHSKEE